MFYASKIIWFFATPTNLLLVLLAFGVLLTATRFVRFGRRVALFCIVLFAMMGFGPIGNMLIYPLEAPYPPLRLADSPPPAGIIILGGALVEDVTVARSDGIEINEGGERVLALIALARKFPEARIVYSGGSGAVLRSEEAEAELIRARISTYGVEPSRILIENRSRNTRENALFTRQLVEPKPGETWLLVTSAWHMKRASALFRAANFPVTPYPVDYRTAGWQSLLETYPEMSNGLRRTNTAMKEWVGILVDWWLGR